MFAIVAMAAQKFNFSREVAVYAISLAMTPASLVVVLTIKMAARSKAMVGKNVIVH
jgi:Na+-exporting ATPase